tara:strand:+ start:15977 stop:16825 length:849 start_codon:yes stop_codon:yes gene_type:complete
LIIGLTTTKNKYENLAKISNEDISKVIRKDSVSTLDESKKDIKITQKKIDSIVKNLDDKLKESIIQIPESARKKILAEVEKQARDSTEVQEIDNNLNFDFAGYTKLSDFADYVRKHPDSKVDVGLDSLSYEKNFTNRFLFTKTKSLYSLTKNQESKDQFFSKVLSYGSIAIFIFLPLFTLFLKFFYIRRKYTYIDHLIFVFHSQTVFFMLFTIFLLLKLGSLNPKIWVFLVLFLLYLIIAMKKFYGQGYLKTILKFLLLNLSYIIVGGIGVTFLFIISFVLF